jgi:glycosyltransferase involved in cell wall biosynthesis
MLNILHLPYTFAPDACGGTETYVEGLASALVARGWSSIVAAPGTKNEGYEVRSLPVRRFETSQGAMRLEHLYGEGDPVAARAFERVLDDTAPSIVHFHAFTPAVSVRLARATKARGLPMVFTFHTPTVSCVRGTLVELGERNCDGRVEVRRCSRCTLQGHGLGSAVAETVGRIPAAFGFAMGHLGVQGHLWTALRTSELVKRRCDSLREWFALMDRIVAPSKWVKEMLIVNDVAPSKIVFSPQGTAKPYRDSDARQPRSFLPSDYLKIAALARVDPAKGLHILIEAVKALGSARLQLDIFGIEQARPDDPYVRRLKQLAEDDARIKFLPPLPAINVIPTLSGYHLLAVPSIYKETGPLVVLEAFAAGIPVLGSDLGGIAERVRNGIDGLLVPPANIPAWTAALRRLHDDSGLLARLLAGVRPPRTMEQVADEMGALYQEMLRGSLTVRERELSNPAA